MKPLAVLLVVFAWFTSPVSVVAADAAGEARAILGKSGVKGGFVVQVGLDDGALTSALRAGEGYQVHGLDEDAGRVAAVREAILKGGAYGPVSVDRWDGRHLPYVEGTVNLLVIGEGREVARSEIDRVLAPLGVALVRRDGEWRRSEKPWPADMDEWTHFYYDAAGNAVSRDGVVGPPERLQWLGGPRWSRHHDRMASMSAAVTARGRLFYIMDEGSRISILLPSKFQLIARDAFNGTVLWKKPIEKWSTNMWPLKTGPTQLTRRMVADGERLFVTLGITDPVSLLDGATGGVRRTFGETKGAEEILVSGGVLYVLVNPSGEYVLKDFAPKLQSDQQRVAQEYEWDRKPRVLMALDPGTGAVLWRHEGVIAPLTTAVDGRRLAYYDGDRIHCLDPKTGKETWVSAGEPRRKLYEFNFGPRLLLHGDVILYAGGDGTMRGLDAGSGRKLWEAPHEKSGYRSPEDLIVSGGLVWNAGTTSGNQSGEFIGRDPRTGEVKRQFAPDVPKDTYWFHHRCYIAKATEKFLIPSRTGIEFVDHEKKHWDLNHWVRGACLYGVIPANGVTLAGPHNCACYPEAKLFGMNALAPKARHPLPPALADEARLEKGPAYEATEDEPADAADWPTYRHDIERSGHSKEPLRKDLGVAWEVRLGGALSALTVAGGKAYVAQVDAHTVHAFDAVTGRKAWHFIAGARVDSPPTWWNGRVIFGCMDGSVYCLRAKDGALAWRFRAAPTDLRHMAFEQLESVWPVHGSVLVEKDVVTFVSGRSCFLDGGMKFFRLDARTGRKLVEAAFDDKDPESGKSLDDLHKTLQMPTALNDILSSNGKGTIYLRSQRIDENGKRFDIAPVSGNAIEQGAAQKGDHGHIFAAFGYLDQEWFHRSLWIFGEHSSGGHNGYYQPGKYAPTGRILVFDERNVYSYGREAKYFKWTTTMEHTLFSASRKAPDVAPEPEGPRPARKGKQGARGPAERPFGVGFPDAAKLDPSRTPLTVECWVLPDEGTGTVVNHGGPRQGCAITLRDGRPAFHVRSDGQLTSVAAPTSMGEGWHHLCGVLADKSLKLYVDGQRVAETAAAGFIAGKPVNGLVLGSDASRVAEAEHGAYAGMLDQLVIHHRALGADEVLERVSQPEARPAGAVLACSFDNGDSRDESGNGIHGVGTGVDTGKGKVGAALWFRKAAPGGRAAARGGGSFVQRGWDTFVPIVTRAMTLAGKNLVVAGPPDTLDEEYAFERMAAKDPAIERELAEQDAALDGKRGARLWLMNVETGEQGNSLDLDSPPVWDGMAAARGRLYIATVDGRVKCFGK